MESMEAQVILLITDDDLQSTVTTPMSTFNTRQQYTVRTVMRQNVTPLISNHTPVAFHSEFVNDKTLLFTLINYVVVAGSCIAFPV